MSFLDYTGEYTTCRDKFIFKMKGGKKKLLNFQQLYLILLMITHLKKCLAFKKVY